MNIKKTLTLIGFFAIGIFLFLKLMDMVEDKAELFDYMSSAPWWAIILTFIMGLLAIISRGLRWIILLEPMGYTASKFMAICAVAFGYFSNTFVPRSGELVRCAALNSTDDIPVNKLFGTVITERVVDLSMLLILMIIAFSTNLDAVLTLLDKIQLPQGTTLFFATLAFVSVAIVGFIIIRKSIKISEFVSGIGDGIRSVLTMKRRKAFILHTFFIWIMYFCMSYFLFKAMKGVNDIGILDALWVMVAGGFGMVFPTPGGIGSYQWAVTLGFESIDYEKLIGVAVANVVWITQTSMVIFTGALGYLFIVVNRLSLKKISK
ncbi:MAG TPA: flippase-like domain-containing protein [Flavobacteriales bacterium]|nr:flippase-like domain-containing protein [Flavobacteriales bacterium]